MLPSSSPLRDEDAFADVLRAPLLVNVLRLLRDGRSADYADHERGPVSFVFGGLHMHDTGPYRDAERVWRAAASSSSSASHYAGPLALTVYIDGVVVEQWVVEDYRDGRTDHSIVRTLEQVEQLNGLARVLHAHLRTCDLYADIVQCCTQSIGSGGGDAAAGVAGDDERVPATGLALRVCAGAPPLSAPSCCGADARRRVDMWAVDDLLRVTVARNTLWRARVRRSTAALATPQEDDERDAATTTTGSSGNDAASEARERSAPVPCRPRGARPSSAGNDEHARAQQPSPSSSSFSPGSGALVRAAGGNNKSSSCGSNSASSLIARVGSNSSGVLGGRSGAPSPRLVPGASAPHRPLASFTLAMATASSSAAASPLLLLTQTPTAARGGALPELALPPSELPLLAASFATNNGGGSGDAVVAATPLPPHVLRMRHVFAATRDKSDDADDGGDAAATFALGSMALDDVASLSPHDGPELTRGDASPRQRRRRDALDLLALCRDVADGRRAAAAALVDFGELVQGFVFDDVSGHYAGSTAC